MNSFMFVHICISAYVHTSFIILSLVAKVCLDCSIYPHNSTCVCAYVQTYVRTHTFTYVCGVENWVDYTAIADLLGDNLTMAGYLKIEGISVTLLCTYSTYVHVCVRTYVYQLRMYMSNKHRTLEY